jgi:hypothetical protein
MSKVMKLPEQLRCNAHHHDAAFGASMLAGFMAGKAGDGSHKSVRPLRRMDIADIRCIVLVCVALWSPPSILFKEVIACPVLEWRAWLILMELFEVQHFVADLLRAKQSCDEGILQGIEAPQLGYSSDTPYVP